MVLLNSEEISFPDPALYDSHDGIIAVGGDLSPERILFAYENGIFPWFNPDEEILWWCPDPRFVLFPDELKVSKSIKKILDRNIFQFTENKNFREVILNCKNAPRKGQDGTWLSDELIEVFTKLHKIGIVKSIEVWLNNDLVGGFYGLHIGNVFCGESMFAKVSNASKAGFIYFVQKYADQFSIVDCQSHSDHLESLGAKMIPKREFLHILHQE
ncbi:leucyl/phenylalanyl-tRNA--protein transferase [Chryseobacterium sp. Leaf180]|uniref:leucyl/phenylalanyl-tRNA--protein transferase n=1 Tax=Chryseobacterium sp. Leaf180 TaxID=1736289 RepID=UPI0006F433A1|nr:leucyl/phenylalanyl-tRNA--protein transferase [Chryseobacterium sp. Leaf180]KQR95202.1 leucyl/phenylalanyl-tRNA--protein transferase [Chryseobacterium sp. Leaf180]